MSELFEKGDVVFHKASGQRAVVSKLHHKCVHRSHRSSIDCAFWSSWIDGEQEDVYNIETGFGEIVEFVEGFKLEKERKQTEIIMPAPDMQSGCSDFILDTAVCCDFGEPKGQCSNCGYDKEEHAEKKKSGIYGMACEEKCPSINGRPGKECNCKGGDYVRSGRGPRQLGAYDG